MDTSIRGNSPPIRAMRSSSREKLAVGLRRKKVLLSPEGFYRDWRGLAEISNVVVANECLDPVPFILTHWERTVPVPTFIDLINALQRIDRYDVCDDLSADLENDKAFYSAIQTKNQAVINGERNIEDYILTYDDVNAMNEGRPPMIYDAFLLYANEDQPFAETIVCKLEQQGLKLCLERRDLVGGKAFTHDAITKLISERCQCVVVVLSKNFETSPAMQFYTSYSLALSIGHTVLKIVPIIYNLTSPPPYFKFYVCLYYPGTNPTDFWTKLNQSVTPFRGRRFGLSESSETSPIEESEDSGIELPAVPDSSPSSRASSGVSVQSNPSSLHKQVSSFVSSISTGFHKMLPDKWRQKKKVKCPVPS